MKKFIIGSLIGFLFGSYITLARLLRFEHVKHGLVEEISHRLYKFAYGEDFRGPRGTRPYVGGARIRYDRSKTDN